MANKQLKTLTLPNAQGEPITYDLHPNWENIENKPNSFPPELDTTLAISGVAADAAAVGEAINSLDKTVAVDENSDGNIEIRSYLPEQDYLQLDKSLTVEGAAAEARAVGDALDNKLDVVGGVASNFTTSSLNLKPTDAKEGIYFSGSLNTEISQGYLEILGTWADEPVRISGLALPKAYNDAACKGYVDGAIETAGDDYAPSGYGLGQSAIMISSGDNLNNYRMGGWYQFTAGVANIPFNYGMMLVIHGNDYNNQCFQYAFSRYPANNMAIRQLFDGEWGEWEWLNPPMVVNTEYRTTERMLGKPVYRKVISYTSEAMTSAGNSFSIPHGITGLGQMLDIDAYTSGYTLPYTSSAGSLSISSYSSTNLTMINVGTTWAAGRTWYIELRYTKS